MSDGPTGWHSAAASAPQRAFKMRTISRATRSAAMPGWTARRLRIEIKLQFHHTFNLGKIGCAKLSNTIAQAYLTHGRQLIRHGFMGFPIERDHNLTRIEAFHTR